MRDALYAADGDRFVPTQYTRGPWSLEHQHAGPPAALLVRAVESAAAIDGGQCVRAVFDILRPVPIAPLTVTTRVLRPGRNVEQLEATLATEEHEVMRARVWRMRRERVALPAGLAVSEPPPAPPDGLEAAPRAGFFAPGTAYVDALEWRFVSGTFDAPGPAAAWTRMNVDLVAGEPVTPLEHLLVMGDAASGISAALDWTRWGFLNVDLSVLLERPPTGAWLAMDAVTRFGDEGAGACLATYFDQIGRLGSSSQALLVAPR